MSERQAHITPPEGMNARELPLQGLPEAGSERELLNRAATPRSETGRGAESMPTQPYELRRVPGGYMKVYRPGPLSPQEVADYLAASSTATVADSEKRKVLRQELSEMFEREITRRG